MDALSGIRGGHCVEFVNSSRDSEDLGPGSGETHRKANPNEYGGKVIVILKNDIPVMGMHL